MPQAYYSIMHAQAQSEASTPWAMSLEATMSLLALSGESFSMNPVARAICPGLSTNSAFQLDAMKANWQTCPDALQPPF